MDDYVNEKRGPLETVFGLLLLLDDYHGSMKVTHIMYRLNLSWTTMMKNIGLLSQQGLVEGMGRGRYRRINLTDKGKEAIKRIVAVNDYILFVEYEPPVTRRVVRLREFDAPRNLYRPASADEMSAKSHARTVVIDEEAPLMVKTNGHWRMRK